MADEDDPGDWAQCLAAKKLIHLCGCFKCISLFSVVGWNWPDGFWIGEQNRSLFVLGDVLSADHDALNLARA